MKIVINTSWGTISEESAKLRRDPQFIEDVETGRFVGRINEHFGYAETLKVVEIPDYATDFLIVDYDGQESILYVVDGKIHMIENENCRIITEK